MAIRTLAAQERYNGKNKEGRAEPRNKLKKLKSVKVAILDRLRLSMRRNKQRFDHGVWTDSSDYATDLSGVSSAVMSGTSSPHYMKATTSSSARKGSLQANSARKSNPSSPAKFSRVLVEDCSDDLADVDVPVQMTPDKSLKRVSSSLRSKKLSTTKSMKIRRKYSQFQDLPGGSPGFGRQEYYSNAEIIGGEIDHTNDARDHEIIKGGAKKGILERSRSRKLTRLRSKRLSRRIPKSRFGTTAEQLTYGTETSSAVPHYMKGTTSHETRKSSAKGLTRTSSLRPLRILAKIPSLRPKRSQVRRQPEKTPVSGTRVDRATCSSTFKRSEYPEQIELHSKGRESEGNSLIHVCPYNYCSLNGHHHHAPSPPIKEFIAAKRQLISNQKGKQLESQYAQDVNHSTNASKSYQSRQMLSSATHAVAAMMNGQPLDPPEVEDDGLDYLIKIYAKPRKKWAVEDIPSNGLMRVQAMMNESTSYDGEQEDAPGETSELQVRPQEAREIFAVSNVEGNDNSPHHISTAAASNETLEQITSEETTQDTLQEHMQFPTSAVSPGDDVTSILSDTQKYTSIWHLIHQQFVSSDDGTKEAYEKEGAGECTSHKSELDQEQSRYTTQTSEEEDNPQAATENLQFNQTAVIQLVQEALHTILQRDAESVNQQSKSDREMVNSLAGECTLTFSATEDKEMKRWGNAEQKKAAASEEELPGQMSKSYSRLRKVFVTAKIIKTMERMKKINPREPRYLSAGPTSEEERVYLRHLSMDQRKNTEEWMLDYALRQAMSKLNPDQQRRVGQLVEAFEAVFPEKRVKGIRHSPQEVEATMSGLATSINIEPRESVEHERAMTITDEQYTCMQDDEMILPQQDVPGGKSSIGESECQATTTDSAWELSRMSYKPAPVAVEDDGGTVIEEPTNILEESSLSPTENSEVSRSDNMTNIFSNKQKYNCMWNLIYQHVVSGKASMDENQEVNEIEEKEHAVDGNDCNEVNDPESNRTTYSTIPKEDVDEQNADRAKNDFDQSAAVKLVKEALDSILKSYEQSRERQSIPEHHDADGKPREVCISSPTSYNEEGCRKGENVDEHVEPEHDVHQEEYISHSNQQQEEANELKQLPKKMSKSLSKLRKAIATTRFIKAMERLRKCSPRKSQSLPSETESKEKVYLRHLSMGGRKNDEEWMLDYALRQVVSKMDPDQQRRVAKLVEAFETVKPEQKDGGSKFYTSACNATLARLDTTVREGAKNLAEEENQRPIADEEDQQVPQKRDGVVVLSSEGGSPERSMQEGQEDLDQSRATDDTVLQKLDEALISESTSRDLAVEELTSRIEQTSQPEVSCVFPTGNSEMKSEDDIATILCDKQNYTSMWHLIYRQVASSDASMAVKKESSEADEEEFQEMNDQESRQIIFIKQAGSDEVHKNETQDQSAAIKLVREAINSMLQSHENTTDQQVFQSNKVTGDSSSEFRNRSVPVYTEEHSEENANGMKPDRDFEPADQLNKVDSTNQLVHEKAGEEAKTTPKKMSKNYNKLRKAFVTAKFIKAMERLQKTNWRKPRHLPQESVSQEQRVYLRHLSMSGNKNDEEWMLDYALRKVICGLAPDQQRKVALLVKAFEKLKPELKEKGAKDECALAESEAKEREKKAIESEQIDSTPKDDDSPEKHDNVASLLKGTPRRSHEDRDQEILSFRTMLTSKLQESGEINSNIHNQPEPKGSSSQGTLQTSVEGEETNANTISESLQNASLRENLEQDNEHNIAKSIFSDKHKHTSMWHLICQHVQSNSVAEAGSELSEGSSKENYMNSYSTSLEAMTDTDADVSDASSVTSELNENDAMKLVKEAIDDILDVQQDKKTAVGEKPERSLSRGYSALRRYIICNKFIKAMQKMQRVHPQTRKLLAYNPGPEASKGQLKNSAAGDRKPTDEWMLDNVLQKVISGLAPVQQRRVALLINAFEKVNPDLEERGKEAGNIRKARTDVASLGGNGQETEVTPSHSSDLLDEIKLEQEKLVPASNREISTERVPQGISEDSGVDKPFPIRPPSVALRATSDTFNDTLEFSAGEKPGVLIGEGTPIGEQLIGNSEQATKVANKVPLIKDLEDGGTYSARSSTPLGKERYPSLWGLILQHVKTDILEETETRMTTQADEQLEGTTALLKDNADNTSQLFEGADQDKGTDVPAPTSFEYQENEAIKLVQETINEILLLPEQAQDNQSIFTSATSEQEDYDQADENGRETSLDTAEVEASLDIGIAQQVEKAPGRENLGSTHNKLSKVILCKRFIKAMDKMRKLKPQTPEQLSDPPPAAAEASPSLRQMATGENRSWEEGMLDHALQQVVGKLAPAQKKRVSLLVQAFEAVCSQPEPTSSWRVRAAIP